MRNSSRMLEGFVQILFDIAKCKGGISSFFKNLYDKANNVMCCACEIVKYCCPKNIEKDSTNGSLESTYMTGYWHLDDGFAYV